MKKNIRLLIVANNCSGWTSWTEKIATLKEWFSPKVTLDITLQHTHYPVVPFVAYTPQTVGHEGLVVGGAKGVEPKWYDQNVTPLAVGYDIVLFVVNPSQWAVGSSNVRGWRTDKDEGPVELHVMGDERENLYYSDGRIESTFVDYARHEILHACYMISGQEDKTHYWRDTDPAKPNYVAALAGLVFRDVVEAQIKTLTEQAIELMKQLVIKLKDQLLGMMK